MQLLAHEAAFWLSPTIELARNLIGSLLVKQGKTTLVGRIVETEAYPVGDPASHAFRGSTARCAAMFLEPGRAYVYVAYGLHRMLNVSTEGEGVGAAVLIRAVELLEGSRATNKRPHRAASGPGLVARTFNIDLSQNGADLTSPGPLWIARPHGPVSDIASSPRIGISKNKDVLWRFFDAQSLCISRNRRRGISPNPYRDIVLNVIE
jgi:DNA-3-methyladenine glycosylase